MVLFHEKRSMKSIFDSFAIKYYLYSLFALFFKNIYVQCKTSNFISNVDKTIFFLRQRFILYKVHLHFRKVSEENLVNVQRNYGV